MAWTTRNRYRGQKRRWLGAAGSLSERLAGTGERFSVQVISQGRHRLRWDEAQALGMSGGRCGYVREVMLRVDEAAVVFARSVTEQARSLGPWRSIRGLGTRPLADLLFKRIGITREPLRFASLAPAHSLRHHVARAWQAATGEAVVPRVLPARRSVFLRRGAPLLVMEVFAASQASWCWPSAKPPAGKTVLPRKKHEV